MDSIQLFLNNKFSTKELVSTKRNEVQQIISLLNFLKEDDIKIVIEYDNFLKKLKNLSDSNAGTLYFQKSDRFEGHRPGFVFKNDIHGLGYYLDPKPIFKL